MSQLRTTVTRRDGVSLLELILVVSILGILIGLLLPSISAVRRRATHLQSVNNLRQIALATHQYSEVKQPNEIVPVRYRNEYPCMIGNTLFRTLLPHLGEFPSGVDPNDHSGPNIVKIYRSPADPSLNFKPTFGTDLFPYSMSYAVNIMSMQKGLPLPNCPADGCSSTIAFCETYYYCQKSEQLVSYDQVHPSLQAFPGSWAGSRRASFADRGWGDVVPVVGPNGTVASKPGVTFQVQPMVAEALGETPKTPHRQGLPCAMWDGSVQTLSPRIAEGVFWSLVTPDAGDVVGDF